MLQSAAPIALRLHLGSGFISLPFRFQLLNLQTHGGAFRFIRRDFIARCRKKARTDLSAPSSPS
jgi:hypothetical protein